MSTKIISSRVSLTQYQEILLECDRLGLTMANWIELQIARSTKLYVAKAEILRKLRVIKIKSMLITDSEQIEEKIQGLINFIEHTI